MYVKHEISPLLHLIKCDESTCEYWKGAWVNHHWEGPWHLLKCGLLNAADSLELHYWLMYVEDPHRAFFFLLNKLCDQQERAETESLVLEAKVDSHPFVH